MWLVPFTQFLLPHGKQEPVWFDVTTDGYVPTDEFKKKVDDIQKAGFRFEVEMLRTGVVSATISDDYGDWAYAIEPNGPELVAGIIKMIEDFNIAEAQSFSAAEREG